MGKPLPTTADPATGTPATGDQANAVVSGSFTAVGVSQPFAFYGAFNVSFWGEETGTLYVAAASAEGAINITGLIPHGASVRSTLLPNGGATVYPKTTYNLSGVTSSQLAGLSNAQVAALAAGTDAAAVFVGAIPEATIALERSFDGGQTWLPAGVGGGGAPAIYVLGAASITNPVSFVAGEPERQVAYRLNCMIYTSGTIKYRISATGLMAVSAGVPPS